MFPQFNRKTKILLVLGAIMFSWGFLAFAIYDARSPETGVTGAIIQGIKSNPNLEKSLIQFANPPVDYIASESASPSSTAKATPIN